MARTGKPTVTWRNVKDALAAFDHTGLLGLLKDLHELSPENRAFLRARLKLTGKPLAPYKNTIARSVYPDVMKGHPVSVAKAKKAIGDYRKAFGSPEGLAELQVFYCEQASLFAVECGYENEGFFSALIRMFQEALLAVGELPPVVQREFLKRLSKVRVGLVEVGWGVNDVLDDLWFDFVDKKLDPQKE